MQQLTTLSLMATLCFLLFFCGKCGKDNEEEMTDDPITMEEVEDTMDTATMDTATVDTMLQVAFDDTIRFASFNVSMFRNSEGQLLNELSTPNSPKIKYVAEQIQRVRPDFLALMEFDYDASGESLQLFRDNYLEVSQNEADTIQYAYAYAAPSNTGVLSEVDLSGDGNINLPNDAYGFGNFAGQYAFAVLSKYPLDLDGVRTFQNFLWKDMPDALLPETSNGESYYSEEAIEVFRLSSKNHIDIPVQFPNGENIHALLAHPTPPVFDGAEDRNGKRNHDEIRLLADYISDATYLVDDNGQSGGLSAGSNFVIMGDLNADPIDGDSVEGAMQQLLNHSSVSGAVATGTNIPSSQGGAEHNQQAGDEADPSYDTSFFGLRIDYVLPSQNFNIIDSGVFWPSSQEDYYYLVANQASSDHLMVWVDFTF